VFCVAWHLIESSSVLLSDLVVGTRGALGDLNAILKEQDHANLYVNIPC
jgi:hypothetical protein